MIVGAAVVDLQRGDTVVEVAAVVQAQQRLAKLLRAAARRRGFLNSGLSLLPSSFRHASPRWRARPLRTPHHAGPAVAPLGDVDAVATAQRPGRWANADAECGLALPG